MQKQSREVWLSEEMILFILGKADVQFSQQTYNINKLSRQSLQKLQQGKEHNLQDTQLLKEQIINLSVLFGGIPKYFISLLNNQQIISHSYIQTLNIKNQYIVTQLLKDFTTLNNNTTTTMPNYLANKHINTAFYTLINLVAAKIAKIYEELAIVFKQTIKQMTQKVKKSKIMNNFLLFKLFREIADSFKRICFEKAAESVFRNCQNEVFQGFFKFLINKFQVVKLFANPEIFDGNVYEPSQLLLLQKFENNKEIDMGLKQAINHQGKFAIFIKNTSENKEIQKNMEDYIVIIDSQNRLQIVNCKTLRKKWFIIGDLKSKVKPSVMAKDYIIEGQQHFDKLIQENGTSVEKTTAKFQELQIYTNYNGIVGRSLYMMKRYTGAKAFFADLSRRAVLMKSMEEIMIQLPIIGYMILAGTFSVKFYQILSNKFSTDERKLKDMLGVMIGTTTTVGSSILGALTGQALIPIPIVGALIGGVIGGFLGDKGGKHINSWMTQKSFLKIVQYLRKQQIDKRYWLCSQAFYDILQIKQKEVQKCIPKYMQDFVFATLVAFILICFYQSKRLIEYNKYKAQSYFGKEQQERMKKVKNQKEFQEQIQTLRLQQDYETEFDLMKIIEFLEEKNSYVYQHFEHLEKSILTYLQKIIN